VKYDKNIFIIMSFILNIFNRIFWNKVYESRYFRIMIKIYLSYFYIFIFLYFYIFFVLYFYIFICHNFMYKRMNVKISSNYEIFLKVSIKIIFSSYRILYFSFSTNICPFCLNKIVSKCWWSLISVSLIFV
jgi:hypothetical protein